MRFILCAALDAHEEEQPLAGPHMPRLCRLPPGLLDVSFLLFSFLRRLELSMCYTAEVVWEVSLVVLSGCEPAGINYLYFGFLD